MHPLLFLVLLLILSVFASSPCYDQKKGENIQGFSFILDFEERLCSDIPSLFYPPRTWLREEVFAEMTARAEYEISQALQNYS